MQNDVILVNIPNDNNKRQLVRNRLYDQQCVTDHCVVCPQGKPGDCSRSGVIYQIQCMSCGATYIGETGRCISVRLKEHLSAKTRMRRTAPLGRHRQENHNGEDFDVTCRVLAVEPEISARKALEAFWISTRNPSMNNRNECLSITNEFLPFVPLCGL